jgi:hypothetical protein
MKLTKMMIGLAALGALAAGCGDSDNSCGDAGCPDGSATLSDATTADVAMQWGLTSGTNEFNITAVSKIEDGCGIMPDKAVTTPFSSRPVTYTPTPAPATVSIGAPTGSPPQPSLGTGTIAGNMATLMRMNKEGEAGATCFWDQKTTGILTLINHDEFTYDVTYTQSGIAPACTPKPPSDPCTSKWQFTFKKK